MTDPRVSDRFLTWPKVKALVRMSRSTVRPSSERASSPRIRTSPGRVAWRESDIRDFVASRWKPETDAG